MNNILKKHELKDGDIVVLRNGDELIYTNDDFRDMSNDCDNWLSETYDIDDNLLMKDRDEKDSDIMVVKRPDHYSKIFERDETVREMTVEEISKELGYEVKIVKE